MTRERSLEMKIGVLVVIALVIFGTLIVLFTDEGFFQSGYHITLLFSYIRGVNVDAPVYLSGVEIGHIEDIQLDRKNNSVKVKLWIMDGVRLRNDVFVTISSRGVMGENFVEITADLQSDAPFLEADDEIWGSTPLTMSHLLSEGGLLLDELKRTISTINAIIHNENISGRLDHLFANINETLVSTSRLARTIEATIEDNRADFRHSVELINTNFETVQSLLNSLDSAEGTLGRLLKDDTAYEELEAMLKEIRENPWKLFRVPRKPVEPDSQPFHRR